MNSNVYVGLSLLGICTLVGAGIAVGSGVAMVATSAVEEQQRQTKSGSAAAHSPFERRLLSVGFAASAPAQH